MSEDVVVIEEDSARVSILSEGKKAVLVVVVVSNGVYA
jgi:hypothetical protein